MLKDIKIDVPKEFGYCLEIRNELTNFIDQFNLQLDDIDEAYKDLSTTYIHIDTSDLDELSKLNNDDKVLVFRIVGATRGGLKLHELERTCYHDANSMTYYTNIEYEIVDVEFIESTCFDVFKVYDRRVVDVTKRELIGVHITISIQK